ncbi:hypothetical protein [Rufibacter aurantiacus]|uniref:hypothetical protein n=1 Tax=Rufibacter aurantiacus TaxID=2817374 RepID=UPI001B30D274|nr:hypothetical protein [Rufibacter aurantiacus]
MDLKYLWIKKFRNIEEQGFSFTDKYIISYSSITKELSTTPNANSIPEGFYTSNIVSLTGILGENGAGKSNIIDFIMTRIASVGNGSTDLYEEENVFLVILENIIFKHKDIELVNQEQLRSLGFVLLEFDEDILRLNGSSNCDWDLKSKIYSTKYIFYASNFERPGTYGISHLIDISTSYKIYHSAVIRDDFPAGYYNEEIKNQTEFLLSIRGDRHIKLPFDIPSKLHITFEKAEDVIKKIDLSEEFFGTVELDQLKYLTNESPNFYNRQYNPSLSKIEELTILINLDLLLIILKHHPEYFKEIEPQDFNKLVFGTLEGDSNISNELKEIDQVLSQIKHSLVSLFERGLLIVEEQEEANSYIRKVNRSFVLTINEDSKEDFYTFIRYYTEFSNSVDIIKRYWMGLSSGQQAYLNLYSRFFEAYKRILDAEGSDVIYDNAEHCTIMIDEGETFYHPQWQKQFVKQVTDFLSMIFAGYNIQVIIASNSPFIASDIPTANINFIKRGGDGKCEVDTLIRPNNTFASNIHTLLTESFFLSGGLIGDLAKNKINSLIEFLNTPNNIPGEEESQEQLSNTKARMKSLINIIGEPVIRRKLESMWVEKFGLEEEVELLRIRLEEAQEKLRIRNGQN